MRMAFVRKTLRKHGPDIGVAVGILAFIGSTIAAATATPKFLKEKEKALHVKAIEQKKPVEEVKLTVAETVKIGLKCYLKSIAMAAAGMASIILARKGYVGRIAGLTSACSLATDRLNEHIRKERELLGPTKSHDIEDAIAKDAIAKHPLPDGFYDMNQNRLSIAGVQPCYSTYYDKYFVSSMQELESIRNKINARFSAQEDDFISVNDGFGSQLRESFNSDPGDIHGWNAEDWLQNGKEIRFVYSSIIMDDGRTALVVSFPFSTEMNTATGDCEHYDASRY